MVGTFIDVDGNEKTDFVKHDEKTQSFQPSFTIDDVIIGVLRDKTFFDEKITSSLE